MSQFFINLDLETEKRFDMSKFLEFTDNYDSLTSKFLLDLKKLKPIFTFVITHEEKKPDLISQLIYGDTQYWWIILYYNDITEIDELVSGKILQYPSLEDLEDLYFSLRSEEVATE